MSRLLWLGAWVSVGLWSLLCAATYGLFDLLGRLFEHNADAFATDPETVEGIWRFLHTLRDVSTGAVLVAWAVVSLLILAVPWFLDRLVGGPRTVPPRTAPPRSPYGAGGGGSPIDLAPDQYSVRPVPPTGSVPRVGPRPR